MPRAAMATDGIRFVQNGRVETLAGIDPTLTVLQWLRGRGRTGTKEGCAEGDCGACTVVLGELDGDRIRYRAVNACILFMPMLDGRQLITVEDLKGPDGALHPVQRAMVEAHASQCGFCTPGFVMSLFALYRTTPAPGREAVQDALAGNLCRCTGYRPILEAAERMYDGGTDDRFAAAEAEAVRLLKEIRRTGTLAVEAAGRRWFAPTGLDELAALRARFPDAHLIAGGTDVGLWVTKQHRSLDPVIDLGHVRELRRIEETPTHLAIGAGTTYADLLPLVERHFPGFGILIRRLGSVQIRNSGTMGGNVANGSPIGDSMPALIALGTTIVLNRAGTRREVALEDFYLAYRKTALADGEFVEALKVPVEYSTLSCESGGGIDVYVDPLHSNGRVGVGAQVEKLSLQPSPPTPSPAIAGEGAKGDRHFATYKVSKRLEQDISAVAAGFALRLDGGTVTEFRAAYGGMAAVPQRARHLEEALIGRPWTLEAVTAALPALAEDFRPLGDMRASAGYRSLIARNLVLRFYLETTGQAEGLDEAGHG